MRPGRAGLRSASPSVRCYDSVSGRIEATGGKGGYTHVATHLDDRRSASAEADGHRRGHLKVAYVMSRFPKLSETFVLGEILAVEEQGVEVELFPLLRERAVVVHPEAAALCERARFQPFLSLSILRSQLHFLRRAPRRYVGALWAVLRGTWGSANYFVGALGIFPKVVHDARLMEADGIAHVHCHFSNHPAAAGFVINRLTGIPYSFTAHGFDLHVDRHMLCEKVGSAAFVVAVSEYNRRLILEECGERARAQVAVVHCGVDTEFFRAPKTAAPERPFSILCVGTLHEVKGQGYLVEACRLLAESGADVACILVGDGPDRAALLGQIAGSGLEGRVTIAGRRTRAEVAELLGRAHVLVSPSVPTAEGKREGIPVVLMEAMASGVSVVASGISGIPELVEDGKTGLLVPPRDPGALASALSRLHDDPGLRERLARAGRETVEREFDVRKNAGELVRRFRMHAGVPA
jgi:colanic acid/amylovoran biosynthesis glycosyltransferase